jgi:hypothetical protein
MSKVVTKRHGRLVISRRANTIQRGGHSGATTDEAREGRTVLGTPRSDERRGPV